MTKTYVTSHEHLPDDTDGEVRLQITDQDTKEIFTTRARLARDPDSLSDPTPLTVVRGPHENIEEQWCVEILETDVGDEPVDEALLRECIDRSRKETNVINARSADVRALPSYLVETGEYDSISEAARTNVREQVADTHPELVERYVQLRTERERDELTAKLGGDGER